VNEGENKERKQKDEDNNFHLLTIRDSRIILIKNMDDTNYINTSRII
jgi:hypothetical protein